MMPATVPSPLSCTARHRLVLINNTELTTKFVWNPDTVDGLWVISSGHIKIILAAGLLDGIKEVCIAYPCTLSNGDVGELTMITQSHVAPVPVHCDFDLWLQTADVTLEQLGLERFVHLGMNFIISRDHKDMVLSRYPDVRDGVFAGLVSAGSTIRA